MERRLALVREPKPGHRNSQGGTVLRDKRGRRIGANWWREYICALLLEATLDWERRRDEECIGYATEERAYRRENPPPNLKSFLVEHAGMRRFQAA